MQIGGNKRITKTVKTKFKKNRDEEDKSQDRNKKHHDKSFYRLVREEKNEYVA
jgi:hypothetical protein